MDTVLVIPYRRLLRTFADRVVGSGEFRLIGEIGGNHDVNIFDTLPKGKFEDLTPRLPYALANARQEHFGTVPLQVMIKYKEETCAFCIKYKPYTVLSVKCIHSP